jgi:hypothetical protein
MPSREPLFPSVFKSGNWVAPFAFLRGIARALPPPTTPERTTSVARWGSVGENVSLRHRVSAPPARVALSGTIASTIARPARTARSGSSSHAVGQPK